MSSVGLRRVSTNVSSNCGCPQTATTSGYVYNPVGLTFHAHVRHVGFARLTAELRLQRGEDVPSDEVVPAARAGPRGDPPGGVRGPDLRLAPDLEILTGREKC